MIRNIAGIMADEEPKTPLSPSGLYNSSYMYSDTSQHAILDSTDMLNNRSEFTFMFWIYGREDAFWGSWSTGTGGEFSPIFSWSIISSQINIEFKIRNTSGGHTVVSSVYNWPFEWTLFSVTGSLLSNSIKLYANGVLLNTATMSYPVSNDYLSYSFRRVNSSPHSLSQPLFYDRALSDAEVAEHYVYDDNTMSSGVLGFNAMTPAQKSGITYLASLTEDISIAGNEFTDKSGNGVTLSPQPTLTGQQIYVYTDANDLPNGAPISGNMLNFEDLVGYLNYDTTAGKLVGKKSFTISFDVDMDTLSSSDTNLGIFSSRSPGAGWVFLCTGSLIRFYYNTSLLDSFAISGLSGHKSVTIISSTTRVKGYIDGSVVFDVATPASALTDAGQPVAMSQYGGDSATNFPHMACNYQIWNTTKNINDITDDNGRVIFKGTDADRVFGVTGLSGNNPFTDVEGSNATIEPVVTATGTLVSIPTS
jgi:hypothetical protein